MKIIWTKYFMEDGNWIQVVTGHEDVAPLVDLQKVVSITQEIRMTVDEYIRFRFKDPRGL